MKEAYFWCYPWDLEDEGLALSVANLKGTVGVNSISVAAATGPVHELRPRLAADARTFASSAAIQFQPTSKFYSGLQIKPVVAPWMKSRNSIARVCEAAAKERLGVRAWLPCCESDSLAHRHSHAACVNALGEVSTLRLCPSHPEVREYLTALVEDVASQFSFDTIELDELSFGRAFSWFAQCAIAPDESLRTLLQWCFCPACRQRAGDAGVDAHSAMNQVLTRLDQAMESGRNEDNSIEDIVSSDEALRAYQNVREESVLTLLKALRSRISARLAVHVRSPRLLAGQNIMATHEHCDAVICGFDGGKPICGRDPGCQDIGIERWEAGYACYPPHVAGSEALVASVHECVRGGCQRVGFANYGIVAAESLDWVRQAIRYARREI